MSNSEPPVTDSVDETARSHEARGLEIETQAPLHAADQGTSHEVEVERAREVGAPREADEHVGTAGGGRPRRLLLVGLDGATGLLSPCSSTSRSAIAGKNFVSSDTDLGPTQNPLEYQCGLRGSCGSRSLTPALSW